MGIHLATGCGVAYAVGINQGIEKGKKDLRPLRLEEPPLPNAA